MSADESQSEKRPDVIKGRMHTFTEIAVAGAAVATLLLSVITSINAAHAADAAAKSAATSQQLFQGSSACRAIRTEILELHQAGLTAAQITTVLSMEQMSDSFRNNKKDVGKNTIDEDNSECGRRTPGGGQGKVVQQWIRIIASVPASATSR
jgi:hypothetical protein